MKVLFLVFAFQRCNSFYISIIRHCENVSCNPKLRPYIRAKKKRRKKERKKKSENFYWRIIQIKLQANNVFRKIYYYMLVCLDIFQGKVIKKYSKLRLLV